VAEPSLSHRGAVSRRGAIPQLGNEFARSRALVDIPYGIIGPRSGLPVPKETGADVLPPLKGVQHDLTAVRLEVSGMRDHLVSNSACYHLPPSAIARFVQGRPRRVVFSLASRLTLPLDPRKGAGPACTFRRLDPALTGSTRRVA
jgi:hypothetical protein